MAVVLNVDRAMTKYALIGAAILAAIAGVLGWLLLRAHEDLGAAQLALKSANAVIAQKEADQALSAQEVERLHERERELAAVTAPVRERIVRVPTTAVDDPAIRDAAIGVRQLLANPGPANP